YTPKWEQKVPAFVRNATIPMPSFPIGLLYQIIHSQAGHTSYLNGVTSERQGSWLFFPQSLLMKEPLAVVALVLTAIVAWVRMPNRRPWRTMLIVTPLAIYLLPSVFGK